MASKETYLILYRDDDGTLHADDYYKEDEALMTCNDLIEDGYTDAKYFYPSEVKSFCVLKLNDCNLKKFKVKVKVEFE